MQDCSTVIKGSEGCKGSREKKAHDFIILRQEQEEEAEFFPVEWTLVICDDWTSLSQAFLKMKNHHKK